MPVFAAFSSCYVSFTRNPDAFDCVPLRMACASYKGRFQETISEARLKLGPQTLNPKKAPHYHFEKSSGHKIGIFVGCSAKRKNRSYYFGMFC
jgi:hypothetical protein